MLVPEDFERRFTLLDAMILVAATAVGLAIARRWTEMAEATRLFLSPEDGLLPALAPLTRRVVLGWPVVAMWTLALVALRLRGPRPRAQRLFAPPGMVACVVAAVVMAMEFAQVVVVETEDWLQYPQPRHTEARWHDLEFRAIHTTATTSISFAVLAAWVVMVVTRRWRPERGWIDRAGRFVGCLSILLVPLRFHLRMNSHLNV
ncbi:MAG TPA: hypothetical protein VGH33_20405 [Isosphaeraceae bacterium]|jgi:hypothetical protein